ncbi:hypothetical protein JCM8202_000555 [Rhodotorula sphaerocarpa]
MPPKMTQPLRPAARYRPGKAPAPVADDPDESDDEQQQQQAAGGEDAGAGAADEEDGDGDEQVTEFGGAGTAARAQNAGKGALNVALKQVQVDQTGKVTVGGRDEVGRTELESSEGEYETDSEEEKPAAKPVFRPKGPAAPAKQESSEYETDSEEESEEEEAPLKPIYKPVFVSKRNRDTVAERQKELDPEALEAKRDAEERKRREEAKVLVADSIIREIATKEAQEVHPDVDDTDGLDPEAEFEAWKLRELMRLKRDREARYALEKVREEVEARRAMPEELRMKEDTERAEKTRKEKKRGQQAFLQKYHHKGVFHQDSDILSKHDYTAPTESTVDVSALPAVMQKRNFGKAHQTKYTHLAAEDTSRHSGGWGRPGGGGGGGGGAGGGGGCFVCGGPHLKRDCPQLAAGEHPSGSGPGGSGAAPSVSGANASAREGDAGWAARRPARPAAAAAAAGGPSDERDRFAAGGGSAEGGAGSHRRGGIGFENRRRAEPSDPYGDRDRYRDERRARSRSRSRSPPRRRGEGGPGLYVDDYNSASRRPRYGGGGREDRDDERHRQRRRSRSRSRSRSPSPRRDGGRRNRGADDRDERGGGGRERGERRSGEPHAETGRDDKRRRLDY